MPKKRRAGMSKAAAIREILITGVDSPTEVASKVKSQYGLDVSPQAVSTVKHQEKQKTGGRKTRKKKAAATRRGGRPRAAASGNESLEAGVEFVKRAGSIEAAKRTLQTIEEIKKL